MNYLVLILFSLLFISCGKEASQDIQITLGRVANGEKINPKHPFEKSMVTILESSGEFRCSATILTKNSILTAAHCFNRAKFEVIINGKSYSLKKGIIYPEYSRNVHRDIAIGILSTDIAPVDFYPVTLDSNEEIPKSLRVIGRSKHITSPYPDYVTAILLQIPDILKNKMNHDAYYFIKTLSWSQEENSKNDQHQSYSTKTYRSESLNDIKSANIIFNNLGGGPRPGDSGGAVIVENKDGTFFQRGVTQFVKVNYQFPNFLAAKNGGYHVHDSTGYANINFYLPWLKKMASDNELGEIKTNESQEKKLTACEEVKFKLNGQFIEKLSFNLLDSTINNNCQLIDQKLTVTIESSIAQCLKLCKVNDQTCKFSQESMKTYKSFLKNLCPL